MVQNNTKMVQKYNMMVIYATTIMYTNFYACNMFHVLTKKVLFVRECTNAAIYNENH